LVGLASLGLLGAQVGGAEIDIEQVGAAGKMKGPGLRGEPLALFEDVGDVFAGEGLAVEGILDGAGEVVLVVDVGQSDDFVNVGAGVKAKSEPNTKKNKPALNTKLRILPTTLVSAGKGGSGFRCGFSSAKRSMGRFFASPWIRRLAI
jgi:hypothetical protein